MDLRSFAEGSGTPTPEQQAGMAVFGRFVRGDVAVPVVGAANATTVAGGFELLLGCDVVVASDAAKFGLPEVKRALFAAGGGVFLGTRIPLAVALEMALTGDNIGAERAYSLGLVNQVVPADQVLDATMGWPSASAQRPARSPGHQGAGPPGCDQRRQGVGAAGRVAAHGVRQPGRQGRRHGLHREPRPSLAGRLKAALRHGDHAT